MKTSRKRCEMSPIGLLLVLLVGATLFLGKVTAAQDGNTWNLPPSPASGVKTPADDAIKVTPREVYR